MRGRISARRPASTGAYILDLLAKTPIRNVHLYDGDTFSTHNAFRAPGAASVGDLNARMAKVDYFAAKYASMRRNIHPHAVYVTAANVSEFYKATSQSGRIEKEPNQLRLTIPQSKTPPLTIRVLANDKLELTDNGGTVSQWNRNEKLLSRC